MGGTMTSCKKTILLLQKSSLNEELGAPLMHDCFRYVHFSMDVCISAPLLHAQKKKKKFTRNLKMSTYRMCLTLMSERIFAWSKNTEPLLLRGQNGLYVLQSGLEEVTHTRCSFSTDYWIKYEDRGWERGGEKKEGDKGRWGKEPLFE